MWHCFIYLFTHQANVVVPAAFKYYIIRKHNLICGCSSYLLTEHFVSFDVRVIFFCCCQMQAGDWMTDAWIDGLAAHWAPRRSLTSWISWVRWEGSAGEEVCWSWTRGDGGGSWGGALGGWAGPEAGEVVDVGAVGGAHSLNQSWPRPHPWPHPRPLPPEPWH